MVFPSELDIKYYELLLTVWYNNAGYIGESIYLRHTCWKCLSKWHESCNTFSESKKKIAYTGGGEYRQMRQNIRNYWIFDDNWIILSTTLYVRNFQNKKASRKWGSIFTRTCRLGTDSRWIRPRIKRMSKDEYIGLSPPYFSIYNIPPAITKGSMMFLTIFSPVNLFL